MSGKGYKVETNFITRSKNLYFSEQNRIPKKIFDFD